MSVSIWFRNNAATLSLSVSMLISAMGGIWFVSGSIAKVSTQLEAINVTVTKIETGILLAASERIDIRLNLQTAMAAIGTLQTFASATDVRFTRVWDRFNLIEQRESQN